MIAIYMCFVSNFIRITDSQSDNFLMISYDFVLNLILI